MRFAQAADKNFLLKLTAAAAVEEVVGRIGEGPLSSGFDSRLVICEVTQISVHAKVSVNGAEIVRSVEVFNFRML